MQLLGADIFFIDLFDFVSEDDEHDRENVQQLYTFITIHYL